MREKTKVLLPPINSGYYLVRIFLKGNASILRDIKEVVYHLDHPAFHHQDIITDKTTNFSFLLVVSESILKIDYTFEKVSGPPPSGKSLVPLAHTKRDYEIFQLEAKKDESAQNS